MALRDHAVGGAGCEPRDSDHLSRCLADDRRIYRHNPNSPVLADHPEVGDNRAWCVITPHPIRVGCAEAMISSSHSGFPSFCGHLVNRSANRPAVMPSRHQRRRLPYHPTHAHLRMLSTGRCRPSPMYATPPRHSRRHTTTAVQPWSVPAFLDT